MELGEDGRGELAVPIEERLASARWNANRGRWELALEGKLTTKPGGFHGNAPVTFEATVVVAGPLARRLRRVTGGPVRLAGEPAPSGGAKRAVIAYKKGLLAVGDDLAKGAPIGTVDLVGVAARERGKLRKCGVYASADAKKKNSVKIPLHDLKVDLYDRRSGKKLGSKTFTGTGKCPDKVYGRVSRLSAGGPSIEVVERWIASKLR